MGQKISRATIFLAYCKINIILNIICVRFFDQISIRTLSLIYSDWSLTKKNFRNLISTTLFHSFARKLESEKISHKWFKRWYFIFISNSLHPSRPVEEQAGFLDFLPLDFRKKTLLCPENRTRSYVFVFKSLKISEHFIIK